MISPRLLALLGNPNAMEIYYNACVSAIKDALVEEHFKKMTKENPATYRTPLDDLLGTGKEGL